MTSKDSPTNTKKRVGDSKASIKTTTLTHRRLTIPKHSVKLRKHIKNTQKVLPNAFVLLYRSMKHLWKHKKLFLGITLIYLFLTILLVKGLGVTNHVPALKGSLEKVFHGKTAAVSTSFTIFGVLLGTTGNASSTVAGAYQSILLLIISLVLIWSLRQTHANIKIKVKDGFYKGVYPFIQFLLVLLVIGLQLVPLIIATTLYKTIFGNGLAVLWYEKTLWYIALFALVSLSFYFISSSIFALYIVTLPDITPMRALRSARELVRYRRLVVIRKVMFLPISLIILGATIIIPLIIVWATAVEWVYFALTMVALVVVHSYMYSLYRELL
ncbi:MAG: hypothetical protein NVSMB46_07250 [Candidatus Saccharimonadales bacterium]